MKRLEATEMNFYKLLLRMLWREHVSKEGVLNKMRTGKTLTSNQKEAFEISRI